MSENQGKKPQRSLDEMPKANPEHEETLQLIREVATVLATIQNEMAQLDSQIKTGYRDTANVLDRMQSSIDHHIALTEGIQVVIDQKLKPYPLSQGEKADTMEKATFGLGKIKWVQAEGQKGPYEKTSDAGNPEYEALLSHLRGHDGKAQPAVARRADHERGRHSGL